MKKQAFTFKSSSRSVSMRDISCCVIPRITGLRGDGVEVHAFTLIELLVVVLIIGILVAIALPQYQKAVWKTKNAQLKVLAKSYLDAQTSYYLANGSYAETFSDLDIQMPNWTSASASNSSDFCSSTSTSQQDSVRYNNDIQMTINASGNLTIAWRSGPYRCGGFRVSVSDKKIRCVERYTATFAAGSFCEKMEAATYEDLVNTWRYYILP